MNHVQFEISNSNDLWFPNGTYSVRTNYGIIFYHVLSEWLFNKPRVLSRTMNLDDYNEWFKSSYQYEIGDRVWICKSTIISDMMFTYRLIDRYRLDMVNNRGLVE